jgi:tetratricopeptide (TPR) repeat protein
VGDSSHDHTIEDTGVPTVDVSRSGSEADSIELDVGERLGRYIVLERLGRGGMAVVYAAYDPDLDRKVAVKLLRDTSGGTEARARLLREAQAMAALAHANVAAVYDVGSIDDEVFLAMEILGDTLAHWLEREHSWRDILAQFRAAGRGLAAAHAAGIVHRDFKPENVLLASDGQPKVTDFGLARAEPEHVSANRSAGLLASPLTVAGALMGTPAYMAPEQLRGAATDARTDQFSFCVSLYRALNHHDPFDGSGQERLAIMVENRLREPRPGVPPWLHRVIARGLRADPAERWPDMEALISALARDPAVVRRRVAIGAVAGLGLVAVVGAVAIASRAPSQLCTGAEAEVARVWDEPVRHQLETVFAKSAKPGHELAARQTVRALDDYARSWVTMRTEACEATKLRGEQTDDMLALRTACLDARLVELRAFVHELATADAELVSRAGAAVTSLSGIADCGDVTVLRSADALPADPVARATIVELRSELARGRGLGWASHYKEALAIAQTAVARATELGHRPTVAEAYVLDGQIEAQLSHYDRADAALVEAVAAAEAGKADGTKLDAWIQLTKNADFESKYDLGLERARLARAALVRLGNPPAKAAVLLGTIADLQLNAGHREEALASAAEARGVIERAHGNRSSEYAEALFQEANISEELGHHAEALERYRTVLAIWERELGPDTASVASVLANMAIVEIALGHGDAGTALAQRSLDIREKVFGPASPEVANLRNELATALFVQHDYAAALPMFERAHEDYLRAFPKDDPVQATPLANLALVLVQLGRAGEALPYIEEAVARSTASLGADNPRTGLFLVALGDIQRETGRLDAALATGRRALAIVEKAYGATSPMVFDALGSLGRTLHAQHQPKAAYDVLARALAVTTSDPAALHEIELATASAAWDAGRDHGEAVALAHKARAGYAAMGPKWTAELAKVDAWLATR